MNLFRLACLGKTLNLQVLFDCCQKFSFFHLVLLFEYVMRSKKTVCLNFLMEELINDIKQSMVCNEVQLWVIGSIAWGFWSYSAALLSRTPKNEGYTDG